MHYYVLLGAVLVYGPFAHTMEQKADAFTIIKRWQDVKQFAGTVIAYQADSLYFTGGQDAYLLYKKHPLLHIGYVSQKNSLWPIGNSAFQENGYSMARFIKPTAGSSACGITNAKIEENKENGIHMRKISKKEARLITRALQHEKAKFDHHQHCIEAVQKFLSTVT